MTLAHFFKALNEDQLCLIFSERTVCDVFQCNLAVNSLFETPNECSHTWLRVTTFWVTIVPYLQLPYKDSYVSYMFCFKV